jgi:hypothetical protein
MLKIRFFALFPGNHENRNDKEVDNNPLYDVCCKLDIEDKFRENSAFIILRIGDIEGNA